MLSHSLWRSTLKKREREGGEKYPAVFKRLEKWIPLCTVGKTVKWQSHYRKPYQFLNNINHRTIT